MDLVLEAPDGRVVGIEVKASSTIQPKDVTGLSRLRDLLKDRFFTGTILYTGRETMRVGDRITAAPVEALWNHA